MADIVFPKNESFEHFALKEIGKLYLKHNQLCNFIADEFKIPHYFSSLAEKQFQTKLDYKIHNKSITDAFGFKATYSGEVTIKSVEAKASYSDFKNGFCIGGEYNYLIAPVGVIPVKEVPSFVGLIEIDFDKFYYKGNRIKSGYKTIQRAKKIKIPKKRKKDTVERLKWRMLYKLSSDFYMKSNWLYRINLKKKYKDRFKEGAV